MVNIETRNKLFKYISQDNPQIDKNIILENSKNYRQDNIYKLL